MKPERNFVAERALAQHCAELLPRPPAPAELLPALARLGERCARTLGEGLADLLGGEAPAIAVVPPVEQSETELAEAIGPLAANCLLASGVPGVTLLASLEARATLQLIDRAFGGRGEAPTSLPEAFPLSAELLIGKLELRIAAALQAALGQGEVRPLRSNSRFAELAPYPAGARIAVLVLTIAQAQGADWRLTLALPLALLPRLLGDHVPPAPSAPRSADPAAAPFAAVPLPLSATLVEMKLPLAAVSRLEVGAVLPVAVARAVPLAIGGKVVARGTVGAQDDRVALKLTQIAG